MTEVITGLGRNATMTGVLCLEDIRVTYPDGAGTLDVLSGLTFEPETGRMTAIMGQSGSGKSTLLSCASALSRPTSGTVRVEGKDVWALSEADRRKVRRGSIGVAFQQANLFAPLTAVEQVLVAADVRATRLRFGATKTAMERANGLLDLVGMAGLSNRRPHELSGGQRQRVNIARALMNQPKLLLADEPTAALDGDRATEIVDLLKDVTHRLGVTTLMVTHSAELSARCDSTWELAQGQLNQLA